MPRPSSLARRLAPHALTITYHAEDVHDGAVIRARAYRDTDGAPMLDLDGHVQLASPIQAFYTLANITVEVTAGASGVYMMTVTAEWRGFRGTALCQREAASAAALRAKLTETGLVDDALMALYTRVVDILDGTRAIIRLRHAKKGGSIMTTHDKQHAGLTNYLLKQQAWAKDVIRQHTARILTAVDADDDDDSVRAVIDCVASTDSMFEAAAWLAAIP